QIFIGWPCVLALPALLSNTSALAQQPVPEEDINQCLQERVLDPLNQHATIAQLRVLCQTELSTEVGATPKPPLRFFRPYKDNYLVFGRMEMDDNSQPFSGETLDTKFELGLTFSLFEGRRDFQFLAPLHIGYSQKSWWNIAEESAPFSEHNYNPEIYWLFDQPKRPLLGKFPFVDIIGFEHQSNGQAGIYSRSWDRSYIQKEVELLPQLSVGLKVWNILRTDLTNDDIQDYLGNGMLSVMFRPNDRTNLRWRFKRGSRVETWSYAFDIYYRRPNVNGAFFIQYQDGYGEALISYKEKSRSLRAGFYFPLDIFE
ncbi:MAG: phospholipase A, partial [Pseudohongiella sp.]|nr:phospholipase A [Pseudohongiella sp.]